MSPGIRILLWIWSGLAGLGGITCLALAFRSRAASRLRWSSAALAFALMAAAAFWGAARTQQPRARDRYYAALDDKRRGDLESARQKLREALRMNPGDPAVRQEIETLSRPARPGRKEASFRPTADAGTGPGSQEKPWHPFHDPSPVKITAYRLRVALRPEAHGLSARADLTLRAARSVPEIPLSLGLEFRVTGALDPSGRTVSARHTNDLLVLRDRLRQGERKTYRILWKRAGTGERLQGGDAISPRGSYLRPEARWYPATGELDFHSPVRLALTLPQGYAGVSMGRRIPAPRIGESASIVWETERPAAMIPLAAGRYAVKSLVSGAVSIQTYLFPRHKRRADAYLQEARSILAFYASRFGPYPFKKLAIAEIPYFPGGYGSTSLLMLTEDSFDEKALPGGFLALEIAHQWWGNSVFPQGPGCDWLSEAFAEYASYLYMEHKGGKPALKKRSVCAMPPVPTGPTPSRATRSR
ncbi:MAG: hypothetical protein IT210_14890 [Armatimonadetes bacterium]|nr:hypothetical protein [Armatimonadota bacterium]